MDFELLNLALDFMLIAAAIWMVVVARTTLGGLLGQAISFITWGAIVLGIAHIAETITFEVLRLEIDDVEFIHRLIVLAGFVLITLGFKKIREVKKVGQSE